MLSTDYQGKNKQTKKINRNSMIITASCLLVFIWTFRELQRSLDVMSWLSDVFSLWLAEVSMQLRVTSCTSCNRPFNRTASCLNSWKDIFLHTPEFLWTLLPVALWKAEWKKSLWFIPMGDSLKVLHITLQQCFLIKERTLKCYSKELSRNPFFLRMYLHIKQTT